MSGAGFAGEDEIDKAILTLQKDQLQNGGAQRVVSAWGSSNTTPLLAPPVSSFQAQQRYTPQAASAVITPVYPNQPPAPVSYPTPQMTTMPGPAYQVSHSQPSYSNNVSSVNLDQYLIPGWATSTEVDKQKIIDHSRTTYQMFLQNVKQEDVDAKIDANLKSVQMHLEGSQNTVVRSNTILDIKNGFAIPSYASNIETVKLLISHPIRHGSQLQGVIPQGDIIRMNLFGSTHNYGQGLQVEPIIDRDGGYKQMGNLENTFICQLTVSHIKSDIHAPIGVTFGEYETSGTKMFKPYKESMGYVNVLTGKRYHYIIPANANIEEKIIVYVNSKEADHPFGYYYSWLTPSKNDILTKNRIGIHRDEYQYELDHPISRYLYFYSVEKGFAPPPVDEKTKCVQVPRELAEDAAQKISDLVMSKIPTRNLSKFDIQFEVINDNVVKTRMDNDVDQRTIDGIKGIGESVNALSDAMREKGLANLGHGRQQSRVSDNLSYPFHFELGMVYLFRDKAEDVYKKEKDKMASVTGVY